MNILIRMAFDGGAYHGFQVQQNAVSVCAVLQDAMEKTLGARPDVKGCSRTDAGVHARDYCLSFRHKTDIPMEKLPLALNRWLPPDIRVHSAQVAPEQFHARYSALGKEYCYYIFNSRVDDPFTAAYHYRVAGTVDAGQMHEAGRHLLGRHDFVAFQAAGSTVANTVRTITALTVERTGDVVCLTVAADGFLYNMVRIIAGTLLLAGTGAMPPGQVAEIVAQGNRLRAGPTLPARGLFLNRVFYGDELDG